MHEVRYVAVAVVAMGSSRRNPKRRKQVVISALMHVAWGNAAAVVVINWLTHTPWSRRLSPGDGATRARGGRCYQLLPWYHPKNILPLLLSCFLCCVVRDREVRDVVRTDTDIFFRVCLTYTWYQVFFWLYAFLPFNLYTKNTRTKL